MSYVLTITKNGRTLGVLQLDLFDLRRHEMRAALLAAIEDIIDDDLTPEPSEPEITPPSDPAVFARSFSSACQREPHCTKQVGHPGKCGSWSDPE